MATRTVCLVTGVSGFIGTLACVLKSAFLKLIVKKIGL